MPNNQPPSEFIAQQTARLIRSAGRRYLETTFETFNVGSDGHAVSRRNALGSVQQWLTSETWRNGHGLVLCGRCGTGKDHLAVAAAKALIELGVASKYVTGPQLFSEAKDFNAGGLRLSRYTSREILIVSDPINAGGGVTEFEADVLYQILDGRYRESLPTVFCLNASGADDLDKRLGRRQADRLLHGATVVQMNWPSYRRAV